MSTLKLIYNSGCIELFLVVKNILFSKLTFSVFILCRFKAFEYYVMTCKYKVSGAEAWFRQHGAPVPRGVKKEGGCPWTQVPGPAAPTVCAQRPGGGPSLGLPADQMAAVAGAGRVLL